MQRVVSDHWYVTGNRLSISYPRYYVDIKPVAKGEEVSYKLKVCGDVGDEVYLMFNNLEDAFYFSENFIAKNYNGNVCEIYNIYLEQKKQRALKRM